MGHIVVKVDPSTASRIKQQNQKLSNQIKNGWALPKKAATALTRFVEKFEFPLAVGAGYPVTLSSQQKLQVAFNIDEWVFRDSPQARELRQFAIRSFKTAIGKSGYWQGDATRGLTVTSKASFPFLQSNQTVPQIVLEQIGLRSLPSSPLAAACCNALAHHASRRGGEASFAKTISFTKELNLPASDTEGKKLIEFVNKPQNRVVDEARELNYDEFEQAINNIMPTLKLAALETGRRSEMALTRLYLYFGDDSEAISLIVLKYLESLIEFLSTPDASKFRHINELSWTGKGLETLARVTAALGKLDKQEKAFEIYGVLYFNPIRIKVNGIADLENSILHEGLHIFIEAPTKEAIEPDPAYSGNPRLWQLETQDALVNPDSYVEYVREFEG